MLAKVELVHPQKDAKCSFPLGPYPRNAWIHEDTPEDGLDKACYEIWRRVQQLSAQLDGEPKQAETEGAKPGRPAESCGRDDVSLLVQLEYLSIVGDRGGDDRQQPSQAGEEWPGRGPDAPGKDELLNGGQGAELGKEEGAPEPSSDVAPVASNKEICLLLAQFPLKRINESEAPDNTVVLEKARIIKDFLQTSMFSDKKAGARSPRPREWQDEETRGQLPVFAKLCEDPASKPLLGPAAGSFQGSPSLASALEARVPESARVPKGSHPCGLEGSPRAKEKSPGGAPGKSEHSYSTTRPSLKGSVRRAAAKRQEDLPPPAGEESALGEEVAPSERGGAPLEPPGGERGAGRGGAVPPVGAEKVGGGKEGKGRRRGCLFSPEAEPGAVSDCSAKTSNGAHPARLGTLTLPTRPRLINYVPVAPGPPSASSNPGYAQQPPPFYQARTVRLPPQQPLDPPPAGCFVRSANPYNSSQLVQDYGPRQPYVRAAYAPMVGYWSLVPEYPYTARSIPKPLGTVGGGSTASPPMAGDGPQCLFQPAYGYLDSSVPATRFTCGRSGPLYNNGSFQMYFQADGSGFSYW
ncbi:uncharacterized protein C1orf94-like [Narcine bancroftii]|uniref:uncharacterized protein C1orf94-like n=1 Tax=Narcine bancroftii TaxID=1343680 RepID=UPI0038316899